jgi:hypothetical protein
MSTKNAFLTALTILVSGTTALAQVPSYVPTSDLLGWWPLNGNPNDASPNGNNFTNNGATNAADRFGAANSAYQFNGTSSHLTTSTFSHTFSDTGSFTVSIWVKKTSTASGVAMMSGTVTAGNFIWLVQGGASSMTFGTNKQQQAWFYSSTPFTVNAWTHYVGTYSGNVMRFYKNGTLVGTLNYTYTGTTQANMPLYVGKGISGGYFTGILDDIGVWSRALTPAEIGALYTGGCGNLVATQPADLQVNLGDLAQFSVTPASNPSTYQWQTDQGLGFQNVINGGQYLGATGPSLTVTNATLANDAQAFRCRVTAGICTDTSDVAVLTVNNNIGTEEWLRSDLVSVYPNPVSDHLSITVDASLVGSPFTLTDQVGRVVLSGKLSSTNTRLDLAELPSGGYVLSLGRSGDRRTKVVKE